MCVVLYGSFPMVGFMCMHMCIVYTGISVQTHTQSFRAHMYELLQSWGLYIKFDAEFGILVVWWVE